MKKWILLLILFNCFLCVGWLQIIPINEPSTSISTPCSSCISCAGCSDADILCEDWDEDNGCTWTEDYDGDGIDDIDQTATHSGAFSCIDKGTYCVDVNVNNDGDTYILYDSLSLKDIAYISFYVNVVSEELESGDDEYAMYFSTDSGLSSNVAIILIYDDAGSLKLKFKYHTGGTWSSESISPAISVDSWHRIRVLLDYTNDDVYFYLDDSEVFNSTSAGLDRQFRCIAFGSENGYAPDGFRLQVDDIKIDSDTMPNGCN